MKKNISILLLFQTLIISAFGMTVSTSSSNTGVNRNLTVIPGKVNEFSFDLDKGTTSHIEVIVKESGSIVSSSVLNSSGVYQINFVAVSNTIEITFNRLDADGSSKSFDVNSLKLIEKKEQHVSSIKGAKVYELSDHLTNIRSIISDKLTYTIPVIVSSNDYFPFGMSNRLKENDDYRFGFNGKEKVNEFKSADVVYDFGARKYDARLAKWFAIDPLYSDYPYASCYNFSLNSPIAAFDPDGKKVLFVNGYYNTGDGDMPKLIAKDVIGTKAKSGYWGSAFKTRANKYFGDNNSMFVDGRGAWNSSGKERYEAGYAWAKANQADILQGVVDENGVQTETFKIVSHSMGGAYSEGLIKYLEENGYEVEKVLHLSTADPSGFTASSKPQTIQLNLENDIVLGYKNAFESSKIKGVDTYGEVKTERGTADDLLYSHADTKFKASVFDKITDLENLKLDHVSDESQWQVNYYSPLLFPSITKIEWGNYSAQNNPSTQFNTIYQNGNSYSGTEDKNEYRGPTKN